MERPKQCNICTNVKRESEFHARKKVNGVVVSRQHICKDCRNLARKHKVRPSKLPGARSVKPRGIVKNHRNFKEGVSGR